MKTMIYRFFFTVTMMMATTINLRAQWKDVYNMHEGLVSVTDNNGLQGYVDRTGQMVIPCQWKDANSFYEGRAAVKDESGKYFLIDKTGAKVK